MTPMPDTLPDWLAWIERQHPRSIDMALERVREVAARMGLARPARHVITVRGTNGKGPTVSFIEAIAREAGGKVGAFPSQHTPAYNPRVLHVGHETAVASQFAAYAAGHRHVITVGGTNAKCSTVAFIEASARAAGWKVGAYTSPHLLAYNERVRIDGHDADDASLVAAFEAVEAARIGAGGDGDGRDDIPLTYFEYGTLAALWLFERSALDLAVLEIGLGGRLDAVNVVDPDVAMITTVDLDHQDWLGDDRELIGFEKAGIARPWKPLVLGETDPPSSVLRHAYAIGASAWRIDNDFFFERVDADRWRWREVGCELDLPLPALAAPVQLRNAATAIAALRALDATIPDAAWAEEIGRAHV